MRAPDICIYHANCDDGIAAAWAIWARWGASYTEYVACQYGQEPPDVTGKDVLIVDFSFKADVMAELQEKAKRIIVLDHHKSAEKELEAFIRLECVGGALTAERCYRLMSGVGVHFDMNKSGARLAWEYAHGVDEMPELLAAVEDRDLWRFNLPFTKDISAALRSYPRDLETFDDLVGRSAELVQEGITVRRYIEQIVSNICDTAFEEEVAGHKVPVAACSYDFVSETAHQLLKRNPDAPFAACVVRSYEGVTYSLRSEDSRMDVSEIARSMGGGGHRNAAGFRLEKPAAAA